MLIRSPAKWIATGFVAIVLVPVVGDFFVELARQRGGYDDPATTVNSFVGWLQGISSTWWYPWLACALIGFGAGVWVDWLLRRIERKTNDKMRDLANKIHLLAERIYESPLATKDIFFLLSIASPLEGELEALGIDLNAKRAGDSEATFMSRVGAAYFQIAPYLERGDLRGAKRLVKELNTILVEPPPPR